MFEILMLVFMVSVTIGMILAMLMLIGCSVYDIMHIKEETKPTKISKSKIRRYRPLVSIVIPAFNEELTIEHCLNNLKKITYKNVEIIVSDDRSKDSTKKIVKKYIAEHPERNIRLVAKRKNGGRGAAINLGLKHAKGEILVAFDADCEFDKKAIHKMVAKFADPEVSAVAANVRIIDDGTLLGMIQRLEYLISFRSKKFNSLINSEYIIGGAGASYRTEVIKKVGGFDERMKTEDIELSMRMTRLLGKYGGLRYASDYVVYTEPVPTYKALFRQRYRWKFGSLQALYYNRKLLFSLEKVQNPFTSWVRLPFGLWSEVMLVLEPVFFTIFVYLAFAKQNPWLFISACLAYTVILCLAVWSDEHLSTREKLKLTAISAFMYPASFVISVVQVSAAIRSLLNTSSIIGIKKVSGSYVTTQRAVSVGGR